MNFKDSETEDAAQTGEERTQHKSIAIFAQNSPETDSETSVWMALC